MKILFIAPLPPPITGNSIAAEALLDYLLKDNDIIVVNSSKETLSSGRSSIMGLKTTLKNLYVIWKIKKDCKIIYITLSQSILGNIKDLITYLICYNHLSKMIVHLHGGGLKTKIFDKSKYLSLINKLFLKKIAYCIVLGESLVNIFDNIIQPNKIKVIPNFFPESLIIHKKDIENKYKSIVPLKILYLSNFIKSKGYLEILDAYLDLPEEKQINIQLNFAGKFESENEEKDFLEKIESNSNINYHGIVYGDRKKKLFMQAHIFCLPTYYEYEGQPISILEAYASGCTVLTTNQGGIIDVFTDNKNGLLVEKRSPQSINEAILLLHKQLLTLKTIGINNYNEANKYYTKDKYINGIRELIL